MLKIIKNNGRLPLSISKVRCLHKWEIVLMLKMSRGWAMDNHSATLYRKEEQPKTQLKTQKACCKAWRDSSLKSLTAPTTASPTIANRLPRVTITSNKEITFFQFRRSHKRKQLGRCITLNDRTGKHRRN